MPKPIICLFAPLRKDLELFRPCFSELHGELAAADVRPLDPKRLRVHGQRRHLVPTVGRDAELVHILVGRGGAFDMYDRTLRRERLTLPVVDYPDDLLANLHLPEGAALSSCPLCSYARRTASSSRCHHRQCGRSCRCGKSLRSNATHDLRHTPFLSSCPDRIPAVASFAGILVYVACPTVWHRRDPPHSLAPTR